jgi:hypothetical protein
MPEVEVGGMTFKGGKMMVLFTVLSTLAGGLWAGFEFYKDYMDMKEIVQNIDIQEIKASNDLVVTKLDEAIDYTRDIKQGLKDDIIRIEKVTDDTSRRMKSLERDIDVRMRELSDLARESEKDARDTMRETEDRIDNKMEKLDASLRKTLQEALDNPLNN